MSGRGCRPQKPVAQVGPRFRQQVGLAHRSRHFRNLEVELRGREGRMSRQARTVLELPHSGQAGSRKIDRNLFGRRENSGFQIIGKQTS